MKPPSSNLVSRLLLTFLLYSSTCGCFCSSSQRKFINSSIHLFTRTVQTKLLISPYRGGGGLYRYCTVGSSQAFFRALSLRANKNVTHRGDPIPISAWLLTSCVHVWWCGFLGGSQIRDGQVKLSSGATRPRGDHPAGRPACNFLPPALRGQRLLYFF